MRAAQLERADIPRLDEVALRRVALRLKPGLPRDSSLLASAYLTMVKYMRMVLATPLALC
jgi:hypothetical protein